MNRRALFTLASGALAAAMLPAAALAQPQLSAPTADTIERKLEAAPQRHMRPERRITVEELKRRPEIRRDYAPSIDIQAINFAFGSAEIPYREFGKVEQIAIAMRNILRRRDEIFLIEGHTDAVGSRASNQVLSERRALSLARALNREFGIPWDAMETVGYGEDYLLVPVPYEEWRNRRVTLRRITDVIRR